MTALFDKAFGNSTVYLSHIPFDTPDGHPETFLEACQAAEDKVLKDLGMKRNDLSWSHWKGILSTCFKSDKGDKDTNNKVLSSKSKKSLRKHAGRLARTSPGFFQRTNFKKQQQGKSLWKDFTDEGKGHLLITRYTAQWFAAVFLLGHAWHHHPVAKDVKVFKKVSNPYRPPHLREALPPTIESFCMLELPILNKKLQDLETTNLAKAIVMGISKVDPTALLLGDMFFGPTATTLTAIHLKNLEQECPIGPNKFRNFCQGFYVPGFGNPPCIKGRLHIMHSIH